MKIVITGAGGFIGRALATALRARHELFLVARKPVETKEVCITLDLEKGLDVSKLPLGVDVVIHLAQANVKIPEHSKEMLAVNTLSTRRMLDYALAAGASQFIFASTGGVYGARQGVSRETEPVHPDEFYTMTKYLSELLVEGFRGAFSTAVLRLYQPYGPGQKGRLIPTLVQSIRKNQSISLNRDSRPLVSPMFIEDVVEVFDRVVSSRFSGVLNVAGDEILTIRDLSCLIGRVLGIDPIFQSTDKVSGDLAGDNTEMRKRLDIRPRFSLERGLVKSFGVMAPSRYIQEECRI